MKRRFAALFAAVLLCGCTGNVAPTDTDAPEVTTDALGDLSDIRMHISVIENTGIPELGCPGGDIIRSFTALERSYYDLAESFVREYCTDDTETEYELSGGYGQFAVEIYYADTGARSRYIWLCDCDKMGEQPKGTYNVVVMNIKGADRDVRAYMTDETAYSALFDWLWDEAYDKSGKQFDINGGEIQPVTEP